jgi:nitronate monooxygenase
MGTRFLAATEARISQGYQREVVRAADAGANTTRTLLYNHLRGTFGWPKVYAPRTIINRSFVEHQAGASFEDLQRLHDEASTRGDEGWGPEGRLATYAGSSIGLIDSVKSSEQIVEGVQKELRSVLGSLYGNFGMRPKL